MVLINVTVPPPQPITVSLPGSAQGNILVDLAAPAAEVIAVQFTQPPPVSVHIEVADSRPGEPGPPGASITVVMVPTLAEYLALDPETQMNGSLFVIPKP